MTLTVVFDNNAHDPRLQTGWGFAAWVRYGDRTVLFDTGADSAVLLSNLTALGLDLQTVEIVVLSHIHGDHTGGLRAVLAVNPEVTIYLPQAFPSHFKDQARSAGATVVEVISPVEILPGLWSTGQMGTDIIEQALVAKTADGLVVITGCAHPGIDEMVVRATEIGQGKVALVLGGFHLSGASQGRIEEIIVEFRRLGVEKVAPTHCTGDTARERFEQAYGRDFYAIGVGWQMTLDLARPRSGEPPAWRPASQGIPAQFGVTAVAVAPSDPNLIYLAAYEPGQFYRSTDGGDSWQKTNQGLESVAALTIVVHPTRSDAAWVGTMVGGYRTTDGAHTWHWMTGLPPEPLYSLAVNPEGRVLYAATESAGVWQSDDDGRTWSPCNLADVSVSVLSLEVAPDGVVLAGTAGQGLWASRDGCGTWQTVGDALASTHVTCLQAMEEGRLYALADGYLHFSRDGGTTWQMLESPGFQALSFAAEPGPPDRLYLGSKGKGLASSQDGGTSWTVVREELRHADITSLVTDPATPKSAYLGTRHNGLYHTDDGGESWKLISGDIGNILVTALVQDPTNSKALYAGTLDGVYRSRDGGEHWQITSSTMGKLFVQGLAVSSDGKRIYAGTRSGIYISEDRGMTWLRAEEDTGGIAVFDILVDPHDQERIYAGSWGHNVLRSTDGGQTWAPIHHGLETLSVHAFIVDPTDPRVLYAGTVEAIYRSIDGGQTWQDTPLTDRPLTTFALVTDPVKPSVLFAGTTEGPYSSTDSGQTWQAIGHESLSATVTALLIDPANPLTLYAGTEHHGLFRSTDSGQKWEPWGLESTSVYAIMAAPSGTIWLGTNRGIFRNR